MRDSERVGFDLGKVGRGIPVLRGVGLRAEEVVEEEGVRLCKGACTAAQPPEPLLVRTEGGSTGAGFHLVTAVPVLVMVLGWARVLA